MQLKDLGTAFTFGWISTDRRVTCLVSQGFVDLVDQPGEGAAIDSLGEGVPGIGCLLQVQGTHQLQAGAEKSHSAAPPNQRNPFSCFINTKQPLKSILPVAEQPPVQSQSPVRGDKGTAGRADSFNPICLPHPQGLFSPPPLLLWSSCGSVHPGEQSHPLPAAASKQCIQLIYGAVHSIFLKPQPSDTTLHFPLSLQHQSLPSLLSARAVS